jgi:hypothetical protein
MSKVTEEMLMAYADGELDGETAGQVARAVKADTALGERLLQFEVTRKAAKDAYRSVLEEPVPAVLVAAVRDSGEARQPARWWPWPVVPAFALAAAAAAGFLVAIPILDKAVDGFGPVGLDAEIATVLETASSGEFRLLARGVGVLPTATYLAPEGVCRKFEVRRGPDATTVWHEIACRHDGVWEIELAVADHAGATPDGKIAPASDRAAQSIDTFLDAIGAGETLDEGTERDLRDHGWQRDG